MYGGGSGYYSGSSLPPGHSGGASRPGGGHPPPPSRRHGGPPPPSSIQNTILSMNATKSAFSSNNLRTAELQKEKKAAAASRRQEQQLREAAKDDLYEAGPGLFDCPQKVQADPQSQIVNQVLGRFEKGVIDTPSCIGIDYQPQTPAPVQHIIGEEDDDPKPPRRPPTLTRPNGGSRLPENISQTHRPAARGPSSAMLPPPTPSSRSSKHSSSNNTSFLPPPPSGNLHPPPNSSSSSSSRRPGDSNMSAPNKIRPKSSSSGSNSRSSAEYEESKKVQDMIRQMKDPISGFNNQMPALLPAIVTPLITEHEGNNSRSVPKYFPTPTLPLPIGKLSASPPLHHHGGSKSSLSEDSDSEKKEEIEEVVPEVRSHHVPSSTSPPPQNSPPPGPKTSNSDSNSTSSSSSSESEDEDEDGPSGGGTSGEVEECLKPEEEEEDSNEDEDEFSLATLAKKANLSKFSPSSASFKDTHSPEKKKKAAQSLEASSSQGVPEKSLPDVDIDFISGLLTTSTQDINLDFAGASTTLPIDRPISPMKQSPEHPPDPPSPRPHKEVPTRSSSRRRSASSSAHSALLMESSEEEDEASLPTVAPKRNPRTNKKRSKREDSVSSSNSNSGKRSSHRKSSSKQRTVSLSSEEESFSKAAVVAGNSSSSNSSSSSLLPESAVPHVEQSSKPEETHSPPASNKKKNMALGNIFGVKTFSSKGGGKGKAGIKVEVIERQSAENPPETTPLAAPKAKQLSPRPKLLCRIPLRLLNHRHSRRHSHRRTTKDSDQPPTIENLYSRRSLFEDTEDEKKKKSKPPDKGKRKSSSSSSSSAHETPSKKRLKYDISKEEDEEAVGRGGQGVEEVGEEDYLDEQQVDLTCMMPPPSKRSSSSSYLLDASHKDHEEEDNEEEHNFCMSEAKRLKDEADKEMDREQQAMKYIQAVLYFILCGNITERSGDKNLAHVMYNETLSFIRDVCRPFKNSEFGNFDNKLAALSLRCQSLLYLKMYKLTQNEYRECQKIIGEHIMKASQQNSPNSNTPSPAGSDGSRSSGYTSSGEIPNMGGGRYVGGVNTPPTSSLPGPSSSHLPPQCLTVPQSVMKKHFQYGTYLTQCHDLWEQADMYLHRGHCEEFIKRLDSKCGTLTLHSALKDLVKYIRTGLNFWSKEREGSSETTASNNNTASSS